MNLKPNNLHRTKGVAHIRPARKNSLWVSKLHYFDQLTATLSFPNPRFAQQDLNRTRGLGGNLQSIQASIASTGPKAHN
jgi:hypothetical protein